MDRGSLIDVNRWGSICSIVAFGFSGVGFVRDLRLPATGAPLAPGATRVFTILFLGLAAATVHGIAWSLLERFRGWSFGAGGGDCLPQGREAVELSMTMTLPLVIIPSLYQWIAQEQIVKPRHVLAAVLVVTLGALGHLLIYGSKLVSFPGIKNVVFPLGSPLNLRRALLMELIYALTYFSSIVLPYRILVDSQFGPLGISVVNATVWPALVFLTGVIMFIALRYPNSLVDKTWIQVRGVIAGLILVITLEGGLLM